MGKSYQTLQVCQREMRLGGFSRNFTVFYFYLQVLQGIKYSRNCFGCL